MDKFKKLITKHLIIIIIIITAIVSISLTHFIDQIYYNITINDVSSKEQKFQTAYYQVKQDFEFILNIDQHLVNCYKLQNLNDLAICQQHNKKLP